MREMVGGCCVCSDDRGWSENPLVYCDGQSCTVAVHQACYGIVTVPTGPWYCRKCESQERSVKVKCELCPSKYGALKRTDNQGWAHVVCALYIPEVRFGNVTTMEPIQLQLIPTERFNKVCYICEEKGKPANASVGACMQCNKAGCRQQFHVTCAQGLGLLCEEAGNYLDNVKYCGYCQHHYSKLRKGGNVKTIPPYKPVANEAHNSDSSSEKEGGAPKTNTSPPTAASKKRANATAKAVPSKSANKLSSGTPAKTIQNNAKNAKSAVESEKKDSESEPKDAKDSKGAKKRKANSRAPTPVGIVGSEVSVVVTAATSASVVTSSTNINLGSGGEKGTLACGESVVDKKKAKIDPAPSTVPDQPADALTSVPPAAPPAVSAPSESTSPEAAAPSTTQPPASRSLVVSVPLANAALSPLGPIVCGQTSVVTATAAAERSDDTVVSSEAMTGGNSSQGILTSDINTGGLKITYEKQMDSINTEVDMELELEPSPSTAVEVPAKRGRSQSQSNEKTDRSSRSRKRNGSSATCPAPSTIIETHPKRSSRSQHVTPPPEANPPGAFAAISQAQMKESPPSSPSSESQSNPPSTRGRTRGRKSAPAAVNVGSGSSKDSKDVKIFQNGISAPHMLGNQLNPNSTMHSKMSDHLNNEIEAHSIFNPNDQLGSSLMGPQLHHKVLQQARASSTSSTASGGSGLSSMLGGGGGTIPQTLDQLLERQWEQGSQFLMEQAQHFDIASLLSCLHQLRAENLRLEEHVSSLLQRRDHLLAVNARLAIPLTNNQPAAAPLSTHPHQINNIHPSVAASHADVTRSSRHNGNNTVYPSHPQGSAQHPPVENGLPPDPYGQNPHRSPAGSQQSPNVRHSSAAGPFPNSGLHRQNADTSGRSAPRPQPYLSYDRQGPSSSSQQQMVIRRDRTDRSDNRDSDSHHRSSSKPS